MKSVFFILFNFSQKTNEESLRDKLSAVWVRTNNLTNSEVAVAERNIPTNASGTNEVSAKFSLR